MKKKEQKFNKSRIIMFINDILVVVIIATVIMYIIIGVLTKG